MSAPLIWILFPLVVAGFLWFIKQRTWVVLIIALSVCGLLGLIALLQPLGTILKIGPLSLELRTSTIFLGRTFILENKDRFLLAFINFACVFWFLGAKVAGAPSKFIPISLAISALLTSALAVEPFLYSSILIELAVIISLPLLINRGTPIGKGVLRFFIYQSLAMPFILLAGNILSSSQINSANTTLAPIAALLLGLGFAFWLGIFPFHVWIPELTDEGSPYLAGFLLSVMLPVNLLIIYKFVNGVVWLKDSPFIGPTLLALGTLMVVTGGIWALFQSDLKRLMGFVAIIQTGFSLVCMGSMSDAGTELMYLSQIPHILIFGLMAYALCFMQQRQIGTKIEDLSGLVHRAPILTSVLIFVLFSVVGLPLFAGFSLNFSLLALISTHPLTLTWLLIGYACLLFTSLRILIVFIHDLGSGWGFLESTSSLLLFVPGEFALILMGIFPSIFVSGSWKLIASLLGIN